MPNAHDHLLIEAEYRKVLDKYRRKLRINPNWLIHLLVQCPDEMPEAYGACAWGYLPNNIYRIRLRCNLAGGMVDWTIAHELSEALLAPYADLFETVLDAYRPKKAQAILHEQQAVVRDQFIEHFLSVLIPQHRPLRIGDAA